MFSRAQKNINYLYLHYDNFDVDIVLSVRRKRGEKCLLTFTYFIWIRSSMWCEAGGRGGGASTPFYRRRERRSRGGGARTSAHFPLYVAVKVIALRDPDGGFVLT